MTSALYQACLDKNLELAALLLKQGANPNQLGLFGSVTMLYHLLETLRFNKNSSEIEIINKMIVLLLDNGADPTQRNASGTTFLTM